MSLSRKFDPNIVREFFDYVDGDLIWKRRDRHWFPSEWAWKVWNKRYPGVKAGYLKKTGYIVIRLSILGFDSTFAASHLVWVWHFSVWPDLQLDHIDHDPSNNRIENLREVTALENNRNKSLKNVGPSGFFGVSQDQSCNTWNARMNVHGQGFSLGTFATKAEAIAARRAAEKLLGFHENHGKPVDQEYDSQAHRWQLVIQPYAN